MAQLRSTWQVSFALSYCVELSVQELIDSVMVSFLLLLTSGTCVELSVQELIDSVMVSFLLFLTIGTLSLLYFQLPSTFLPSKGRSITTLEIRWHFFSLCINYYYLFQCFSNLFYSCHCLPFPFLKGYRLEKGHIVPVL